MKPIQGILSTSEGRWRVLVDGVPICADKNAPAAALAAARQMRVKLLPTAWNGDRGEWVELPII